MKVFIDDGSTNIKMLWVEDDKQKTHISPNSFKRGWSAAFLSNQNYNYEVEGEKYSYDEISPDALKTNNVEWQYNPANALAIHHALMTSGIKPQPIEVVVTLPLSEFYDSDGQYRLNNIERKKANVLRKVIPNKGEAFTITKVVVRPESIPAGIAISNEMKPGQSLLIIDLGGTTLDVAIVASQLTNVSRVFGDPKLGVSIVTDIAVRSLNDANTPVSRLNAERFIINRATLEFITDNINDPNKAANVQSAIDDGVRFLCSRVIEALAGFTGYTHALIVGGGADLIEEAVRKHIGIREDRIFVPEDSQLALVYGLALLG